jgi:hypothetical protein
MPSIAQFWEWVRNITGGLVLAAVVVGFITRRLVPGYIYEREVSRADGWMRRYLDKVDPTSGVRDVTQ